MRNSDHAVGRDFNVLHFGEIAGINVRQAVPATHGLDSRPLLHYHVNPRQDASPIRASNFSQHGTNTRSTSQVGEAHRNPKLGRPSGRR